MALNQISLEDIKLLTNNFADANRLGEDLLGKTYKGQLSVSGELIDFAARRIKHDFWLQDRAFEKEISILSRLKHKNIISIVGFCHEDDEVVIINKRVALGRLRKHLNDPSLTWMRRLQISVGAASALSYLHDEVGKNYSIIHHNINSDTILLDENWEAKISGFEYSMSIPSEGLDLAYEKLRIGTYKSDMFSIGVVLFELLCGREAFVSKDNNTFQPSSAIFHYVNGTLHKFVHQDLFSQMDLLSFNIFSETAYYCVTHHEAPPTMNQVLERLQKALEIQRKHEKKEHPTVAVERILPEHLKLKLKSLEHMRIQLVDILLATGEFSKGIVSTGGYGSVHEADLDHVDKEYCCAMEADNGRELPKKRSKVAIKRITNKTDEMAEQGFYAEIEMLTSCKHSNIINLLGFCEERGEMILIYEYASKGSLNEYIRKKSEIHNDTWAQRMKICLDVAKGLSYLHTAEEDRQEIVHRDIKSANILLDENFKAKIGDFGLSVFLSDNKEQSTLYSRKTAGTPMYKDPQYIKDAKLKKELDVYSFGVVLFEILCGTLAFETKYLEKNKGLAFVAREHFRKETIKEIVDPKIKKEITETIFNSVEGPNQESVDKFTNIAYKCLAEAQVDRPTMKTVIEELEKTLFYEEKRKEIFQISLKDIQLATDNFSDENFIEDYGFLKAYEGEVSRANGNITRSTCINVKRLNSEDKGYEFGMDLKVLMEYKHENVIGLLGYCEEGGERIIVNEHAVNGSLDDRMNNISLTWGKRLKICIDIASGLDFLHGGSQTGEVVIHRDIRSRNILLDADVNAKISNFGFSVIHPVDQETVVVNSLVGTQAYWDPDYERTYLVSKECDIYSFGIVLFEILLQRLAYDFDYEKQSTHLGPLIKDLYKKGKLDEVMFEGKNEQIAPQSLTIFRRLAIQCLHDNRNERPTAREAMIQLKEALEIQEKGMNVVGISLEDIKYATDNFSYEKMIGRGATERVFKGELSYANGQKSIVVKQMYRNRKLAHGDLEFYRELEILFKFKHRNVIGLEGYCDELDERIIVYEYASNGSLDKWLNKIDLTWTKRLKICIDVASGLSFFHGDHVFRQETVIHRDLKSANILLSWDWEAKITHFGLSLISPNNQEIDYVIEENPVGTVGYVDPTYLKTSSISKTADIYSFGVVLFEILCGRLALWDEQELVGPMAKKYYEQNKLDELVFEGIREQIMPQSMSTFVKIAYNCLHDDRQKRPTATELVAKLKEALKNQEDCEMWESKLPKDYKEIIQQSRNPKIYNTKKKKKDIYNMLHQGILIQKGKVLFSLDDNNQRSEMISATLFTYKNQSSLKWIQYRKSRFNRVPLIMDISNLMIQAHIKAQFLSPSVIYGVYLVFRFVEPDIISSEPKYVNLKYTIENETSHAYFATRRKDNWMMVELYRFLNHKEDGDFEIILESFSKYYCRSGGIYIEGIEFRAIDSVTHEQIEKLNDVQQIRSSNSNIGQTQPIPVDDYEMFESPDGFNGPYKYCEKDDVNGKKCYLVSAKYKLYDSSMHRLSVIFSEESRFREVTEVPSQQVFSFKTELDSAAFSSETEYKCYLIFKLSKRCHGLHCPVKVRDLLHRNNKETKALYFRSPNAWNIHDINQVPKQREDGWMEVYVWKFNTKNDVRSDNCIPVNLKFISYEGTMFDLIVNGMEYRPI